LAPKSVKSCEIPREFEVIAGQGHPRLSILMSIERAYATSY